jgi:hypothetical protein
MLIARRLYVYFVAAVSLGMVIVGLSRLLGLAFARIGDALGASVIQQSPESVRRELSLYVALLIVALPVWLLHWWLAERAVHRPGISGEQERTSALRALYLTLALAVPLPWLIISVVQILRWLFTKLLGGSATTGTTDQRGTALALVLVTVGVIAYHALIRLRDSRGGPLEDEAAWLPRLYIYAAAFTGAMLLLFGLTDLLRVLDDALFGAGTVLYQDRWWAAPLSSAAARAVAGLLVWSMYWAFGLRLLRRSDWLGASERRSALRWFYVYALVFVGVLLTLRGVSSSLNAVLRLILSVPRRASHTSWASAILEPLIVAIPFAAFWAYHRLVVLAAGPGAEPAPLSTSLRRLYIYLVALIGLAFSGVGSAWVLGILLDLLFGGTRTVSVSSLFWRDDVARYGSIALVGAAAWLWHWNRAEQSVAEDEAAERGATSRRMYLYATLAASLIAILISLAIVLYRVISAVLGVSSDRGLASTLSAPLGIVIVAGALFAYHVRVLRRDLAEREGALPDAVRVTLLLVAPADADVDATVSQLRAQLPEGFTLERTGTTRRRLSLPATSGDTPGDEAQAPVVGVP